MSAMVWNGVISYRVPVGETAQLAIGHPGEPDAARKTVESSPLFPLLMSR
jgi:hypothetical protein